MKRIILSILLVIFLSSCNGLASRNQASSTPTKKLPTVTPSPTLTETEMMDKIEQDVIELRGLAPTNPVDRALLTSDELHEKVISDFFADYTAEDAADDVAELNLLGLLPEGFDLYQFYIDLYSEQVGGYYDPELKEMYVVADTSFGGVEQMVYSHEYVHVLQDQTYDMQNGLLVNDDYCETHTEYCGAVTALVEGDASLTEQEWLFGYASPNVLADLTEFYSTYESPVYDSAPAYMQQDFLFPYMKGMDFVDALYNAGGWEAVDEAYANPPVDTEQILHPELYPDDTPMDVPMPDFTNALDTDWRESTRNVMGEWYWYLVLAYGDDAVYRLDETTASTATSGWGGDSYLVYRNDKTGASSFYMRTRWDTTNDANEFWDALKQYAALRWGAPDVTGSLRLEWNATDLGYVTILMQGAEIVWIIAPDAATAEIFLSQ